ncbi:hypothetical protein Misp01_82660 [Microtetraspora sp. NBRC 13810]|uniref:ribonuclease E/G n=1 Tax=Microtetraspora sp. NBRC 13810 TaxID=3030990 RepID=UPI0024A0EA4A|nr:ribonuclease E/G [Microtetraspora sp. NBRC 13810]GLW13138.1 hypothetical protein Misp01_82660 [Microtetraspora sp. NBRC 13810]
MLDNELIAGADGPQGDTTEQQPVKTVRRRAASRPAGPPPEEAERAAGLTDTPAQPDTPAGPGTAPAPETAPDTSQVAAPAPETPVSGASAAEAAAPGTAPAPDAGAEPEAAPKRATRRRTASTATTTGTTRRTRTSKKAQAEAALDAPGTTPPASGAEPVADTTVDTTAGTTVSTAADLTAGTAAEPVGAEAVVAEEQPVKRRRSRKKAETVEEPAVDRSAGAAAPAGTGVPGGAVAGESAELEAALPEEEPLDDEPPGEDLDVEPLGRTAGAADTRGGVGDAEDAGEDFGEDFEDDESERPGLLADPFGLTAPRRPASAPAVSFQAPSAVFTPLFQAPEPFAADPFRQQPPAQPVRDESSHEEDAQAEDAELAEDDDDIENDQDSDGDEAGGRRRRRRRGGRGRGKARDRDDAEDGSEDDDGADAAAETDDDGEDESGPAAEQAGDEGSAGSRRRRRRRRRGGDDTAEPTPDDPPNTVVRIRAPRAGRTSMDEVQSVRGSTRLEAKKQRRREGRELGRRRPPIITESEFLARRESVERVMVVRRQGGRTQIAVMEDGVLVEHYVDREASQSYVGNVYLGKVQNVLPSMEAAFVDIGKGRNAVLYAGEVNFDTAGLEGQPKRIESALKSGQSVLVQVTKDPMGHKGARLTSQISLPGRYLVYVPDGSMTGISRKLPDKERARLKSILKKVMPENAGVIVRTAAEGASEEELGRDVARLSAQWENIRRKAKSASPPELLSSEPDLTIRVVRDVFNEDFSSLVVAGEEMWDTVDEYVKYVAPHLADRITRWEEGGDVFAAYRIDEQIAKALERKVWLPSGGSLVIDRTEAMTVVDVNTGKFTGQGGNLEETVTRNNLEAAEEIVRQLRLRDIGGIIVIDFIDMVLESNRDLVLRRLLECLARDRTKHQVAEVTSLGLVQMTRKRVGQGLLEAFSTPCECCNGRGLHVSTEPVEGRPEPRGTQGKMAIEKAVADKISKNGDGTAVAAGDQSGRDTVTDALDDVPAPGSAEDDQAAQTSGRGRRRSRRAKSSD